jgi:antitoxin MazE
VIIAIPKPILRKAGVRLGDKLKVSVDGGRIVLTPSGWHPRRGWAADSAAIAAAGEDGLVWPEFGNEDDKNLT